MSFNPLDQKQVVWLGLNRLVCKADVGTRQGRWKYTFWWVWWWALTDGQAMADGVKYSKTYTTAIKGYTFTAL